MTYIADDGTHYDSVADYITEGLCGLCGCGTGAPEDDLLRIFRSAIPADLYNGEVVIAECPDGMQTGHCELILKVLDAAGLFEHGSSVFGSWLSPLGYRVAEALTTEPK